MPPIGRRDLLRGTGALVAAGRARVPVPAARAQDPTFRWGVASFDPTPEGVLLWTRVAPDPAGRPVPLQWVLAADEDLADVVAAGTIEVDGATDHCAVVEATGLPSHGIWWYAFTTADGARSPVGRTRTMPADVVDRLRLAVVSCSRFASGGFAAYRALGEREVDLVVHVGDYIYEDGSAGRRAHEPPVRLRSVDQYRARYAQHRLDPDLQALHQRHPVVAVWDDHEVADNAWRDGAAGHDPAVDGPWLDRLLAATQAHEEWLPGRTRRSPADGRLQAWRSLSLGGLAELVVLDTRTWARDRPPATAAEMGAASGTARTLLGADQLAFVTARLRPDEPSTRPPWVLLANQVMFHPLAVPVPLDALAGAIEGAGYLVVDGDALNPDQWDGYPQAREELSVAMGGEGGVVVLTGDVHSSWAWEGPANDGGRPAMVELVTPSVSAESLGDRLPLPARTVEAALTASLDDLSYVELTSHGYLVVDLDPDHLQAEWWYVDPDGPGSQRFGAARVAPRAAPMHLSEVAEPRPDPVATTTTTTTAPSTVTGAPPPSPADDDGLPVGELSAGAAAVVAAIAGAVAVRRRVT